MDVWNEQYVDIGLTVIGFLAAAGLGMVIHSAIAGRARRAAVSIGEVGGDGAPVTNANAAPQVQFVDLRRLSADTTGAGRSKSSATATVTSEGRRDRVEIVRLARQMLKAGTPVETVRRALPISEMELALLQSTNPN
ncbi:MAG: hypothetical protein AB1772_00770 [Candidatus Zixiibacteriota bacterium]